MRFYFNCDLNMCATEEWLADYLFVSGEFESRKEVIEELQTSRELNGWFDCSVSKDIERHMI